MVVTANGEVQTNEDAQVHVHDLDLFVIVQLLEDTSAVLSLGKLCEEHGYSYESVSGQKRRLTKQVKKIVCRTDNFVPLVVPGLSSSSGTSSSSTSPPQDSSSTSSSTCPTLERFDEAAPGIWCETHSETKTKETRGMAIEHTCLRTQIRNVLRKCHKNEERIVYILTSQKTEIAISACELKLRGLLAEDALAKQYFEPKSFLVT